MHEETSECEHARADVQTCGPHACFKAHTNAYVHACLPLGVLSRTSLFTFGSDSSMPLNVLSHLPEVSQEPWCQEEGLSPRILNTDTDYLLFSSRAEREKQRTGMPVVCLFVLIATCVQVSQESMAT